MAVILKSVFYITVHTSGNLRIVYDVYVVGKKNLSVFREPRTGKIFFMNMSLYNKEIAFRLVAVTISISIGVK